MARKTKPNNRKTKVEVRRKRTQTHASDLGPIIQLLGRIIAEEILAEIQDERR